MKASPLPAYSALPAPNPPPTPLRCRLAPWRSCCSLPLRGAGAPSHCPHPPPPPSGPDFCPKKLLLAAAKGRSGLAKSAEMKDAAKMQDKVCSAIPGSTHPSILPFSPSLLLGRWSPLAPRNGRGRAASTCKPSAREMASRCKWLCSSPSASSEWGWKRTASQRCGRCGRCGRGHLNLKPTYRGVGGAGQATSSTAPNPLSARCHTPPTHTFLPSPLTNR